MLVVDDSVKDRDSRLKSRAFVLWKSDINLLNRLLSFFIVAALQHNNLERAADWIFSHAHELDSTENQSQANQETGPQYKDGSGSK